MSDRANVTDLDRAVLEVYHRTHSGQVAGSVLAILVAHDALLGAVESIAAASDADPDVLDYIRETANRVLGVGGSGDATSLPQGVADRLGQREQTAHNCLSLIAAAVKEKIMDAATGRDESKGAWVDYYAGMQDAYREVLAFVQYELDQTRGLGLTAEERLRERR